MAPPLQGLQLDIDAISGICGSISIACWVVVFSPQIIENFRRGSAEGLSVVFIVVWLAGDVFNILGAVLQGVLPTMIILAVYYTLADIVLLGQCFYYKGFTLTDTIQRRPSTTSLPTERSPLLNAPSNGTHAPRDRRPSASSLRDRLVPVDVTHLSPATPLLPDLDDTKPTRRPPPPAPSALKAIALNALAILLVSLAGALGWYLSAQPRPHHHHHKHPFPAPPPPPPPEHGSPGSDSDSSLHFNVLGQTFGYICAALYLGSRVPQLLLNHRRKSTEGISMLFFLFACVGNLTYVLSILAYAPVCAPSSAGVADAGGDIARGGAECAPGEAKRLYGRYVLVNLSWLVGSAGTLVLDAGVFVQYFLYKRDEEDEDDVAVVG